MEQNVIFCAETGMGHLTEYPFNMACRAGPPNKQDRTTSQRQPDGAWAVAKSEREEDAMGGKDTTQQWIYNTSVQKILR